MTFLSKEVYVIGDLTIETAINKQSGKVFTYYGGAGNLHRNLLANDVDAVLMIPDQLHKNLHSNAHKHRVVSGCPVKACRERIYIEHEDRTVVEKRDRDLDIQSRDTMLNIFPKYTSVVICLEQHFQEVDGITWWLSKLKHIVDSALFIDFRHADVLIQAIRNVFTQSELQTFCDSNRLILKNNQHVGITTEDLKTDLGIDRRHFVHITTLENGSVNLSDLYVCTPLEEQDILDSKIKCTIGCGDAFYGAFISGFLQLRPKGFHEFLTLTEWLVLIERGVYTGTVSAMSQGVTAVGYLEALHELTKQGIIGVRT